MASNGTPRTGLAAIVILASLLLSTPATAADFIAKVFEDTNDGLCTPVGVPVGFLCSLREAVIEANASPGKDTIELLNGTYELTIVSRDPVPGASGPLDVREDLDIIGPDHGEAIIDGSAVGGVIGVSIGSEPPLLQLFDLTITGGIDFGVAAVSADVYLWRVNVEDCGGSGFLNAALMSSHGVVLIVDSWFRRSSGEAAVHIHDGTLLLTGSTISDTSATHAAVYCDDALVNLVNSTMTNSFEAQGTALSSSWRGCDATIDSCTMAGNNKAIVTGATSDSLVLRNSYLRESCELASGSWTSQGGNVGHAGSCGLNHPTDIDISGTSGTLVMPLGQFGGLTPTMPPTGGPNPLVDNPGTSTYCQIEDQRGVHRSVSGGSACDTGAVERTVSDPIWADAFEGGNIWPWSAVAP